MQFPPLNPVALQLGPLDVAGHTLGPLRVHWYGVMYGLGFLLTYFIVKAQVKRRGIVMPEGDVADFIMTLIMGVILGGRLGYILFYNLKDYLAHPLEILAVWHGGMSFHGGLIGTIVAGWYYCRKHKLKFLEMADIVMVAVPLGLGLGRLGNFINGELWGRPTDLPWGMVFPTAGDGLPRHPSQLYEFGLEGIVLFLLLFFMSTRRPKPGVLLGTFLIGYGVIRFGIEFLRNPDPQLGFVIGNLSMGQLLSVPMVLVGAGLIAWVLRRKEGASSAPAASGAEA
ncbi:prolipoprotein diacylglyceryl transferase [bacterium]|nr:prolipoprotein diacylglyceryl transferase [bacterium]